MLELLYKIFIGHNHKWVIIRETPCEDSEGFRWHRHYVQCETCGKIKIFDA